MASVATTLTNISTSTDEASTNISKPTKETSDGSKAGSESSEAVAKGYSSMASTMVDSSVPAGASIAANAQSSTSVISSNSPSSVIPSRKNQVLLGRCRDILRTYKNKARDYRAKDDSKNAMRILSHVGDRVLDAINDAGDTPLDAQTLRMIMNTYIEADETYKALQVFEIATGLSSDGSNTLVTSASHTINGKQNTIPASPDSTLNVYTATSLLKAHASNNDIESVRRVLSAMTTTEEGENKRDDVAAWPIQVLPDSQCYNILLGTLGNVYGSKAALDLFERMPKNKSSADLVDPASKKTSVLPSKTLVTYNTMLDLLAKEGRLDDAYAVFDQMKAEGLKPDNVSYTSLIKAQVNGGSVDDGMALIGEMISKGIKVDVLTYNTIIKGLCQRGKWYEAQGLVAEMEQRRGISPNSVTYVLLMNGLLKSQRPSSCLVLFETATSDPKTSSLMENVQAYTTAVTAASAMGDYDRAFELVGRMQSLGIKPNIQTLTSLMSACLSSGKPEMAICVYKQMQRLTSTASSNTSTRASSSGEQKIDGVALVTLLRAMCDNQEYDQAMKLLSKQKDGYQQMNGKQIMLSYKYVIQSSLYNDKYEMAKQAFVSMLSSGYIPSKDLIRTSILEPMGYYSSSRHSHNNHGISISNAPFRTKNSEEQKDDQKFEFLLDIIDRLRGRKLPCDVLLYTAALSEGTRQGGKNRYIASLLANSRKENIEISNNNSSDKVVGETADLLSWVGFFQMENTQEIKRTLLKNKEGSTIPTIIVQKAKGEREVRILLSVERSLSGITRPLRRKR